MNVRVEGCRDHVVPVLPDLGPDEGVDLVVPRGEVEERRVDGEVGVEGVDERAEAAPGEGGERPQVLDDELHHPFVELHLLRVVEGVETSLKFAIVDFSAVKDRRYLRTTMTNSSKPVKGGGFLRRERRTEAEQRSHVDREMVPDLRIGKSVILAVFHLTQSFSTSNLLPAH